MMRFIKLLVLLFLFTLATLPRATEAFRRPGFLYTRNSRDLLCTPQFWSSRREEWPRMVRPDSTVSNVFGSMTFEQYRYDLTLMEAAAAVGERNDDMENTIFVRLLKESTAALLNSYARKITFTLQPWEFKTSLIQALVSEDAAAHQAQLFSEANMSCN